MGTFKYIFSLCLLMQMNYQDYLKGVSVTLISFQKGVGYPPAHVFNNCCHVCSFKSYNDL